MSNVGLDFDFSEQQTEFHTSTRTLKLIIATILHFFRINCLVTCIGVLVCIASPHFCYPVYYKD